MFKEGQAVWVASKDSTNKYKAIVIATGEHFTCVYSWVDIPSMKKKEIVQNERVFALEYDKVKTIKIGEFDVPEPLRELPEKDTWVYTFEIDNVSKRIVTCLQLDITCEVFGKRHLMLFERGLLHLTKEAALLHAKALLSFTSTELKNVCPKPFKVGDRVKVIQKRTSQGLSIGTTFTITALQPQPTKFYPSGYSCNGYPNGISCASWGVDPIALELSDENK